MNWQFRKILSSLKLTNELFLPALSFLFGGNNGKIAKSSNHINKQLQRG